MGLLYGYALETTRNELGCVVMRPQEVEDFA
jgi:hypothetical protein